MSVNMGEGLHLLGKVEGSSLPFAYDDRLSAGGAISVYCLDDRVFLKPGSEGEARIFV